MLFLFKKMFLHILVIFCLGFLLYGCSYFSSSETTTPTTQQQGANSNASIPPLQINDAPASKNVQVNTNTNIPLPEIIYDRVYDETPTPVSFAQAFQEQLIYALRVYPRPQIQSIHFHFFHYIDESLGQTSLRYPPAAVPRYLFNLKVSVLVNGQWRGVEKDVAIPVGDRPPYQYAFDETISMILNL